PRGFWSFRVSHVGHGWLLWAGRLCREGAPGGLVRSRRKIRLSFSIRGPDRCHIRPAAVSRILGEVAARYDPGLWRTVRVDRGLACGLAPGIGLHVSLAWPDPAFVSRDEKNQRPAGRTRSRCRNGPTAHG